MTRAPAGRDGPILLAVESSCDETGIAVVAGGRRILSNVVASQTALHAATGGIVPEVAARAHLRWIVPVLDQALADASLAVDDVDAIAVTHGPGLAGSLLVGINFAKTIAWVHDKPLVGVNHLEGHLYAAWLTDPGAAVSNSVQIVWIESITSTRGRDAVAWSRMRSMQVSASACNGSSGRPSRCARDATCDSDSSPVTYTLGRCAPSVPSICSSRVDLPMPGSPPISTTEPCTSPPPSTRSSSPIPVSVRASVVNATSVSGVMRATPAALPA